MIHIGELNRLRINKEVEFGVYLDAGPDIPEILLPLKAVPAGAKPGDTVDVFLYYDSEDRLIATTVLPLAMVGEFASMPVVETTDVGTFVDWGIPGKDLLIPFREHRPGLQPGDRVIVRVYLDPKQGRIVGSTQLDRFLDRTPPPYHTAEEVDLLIARQTELGYAAIVNDAHWGLIYAAEIFEPVQIGERRRGFVKSVRPDGKIDLTLHRRGYQKVEDVLDRILRILGENGGFLPLTDKSSPEDISEWFGVSKKTFKQAVGALYKKRAVTLEADGIRLAAAPGSAGGKKRVK